jgi:hypothetical protein
VGGKKRRKEWVVLPFFEAESDILDWKLRKKIH